MAAHRAWRRPRALLFDRLLEVAGADDAAGQGYARGAIDPDQLESSVAQSLDWLLNTRAPVHADELDRRTAQGMRSTIDYGLPDLTLYPIGDAAAMQRLRAHLTDTVRVYEPRITDPVVRLLPLEGRSDAMVVVVDGVLHDGGPGQPASFRVPIRIERSATRAG